MSIPSLTGVILAGGLSRRLGQDKARLCLGGQPLALRVAAALKPFVAELWLVTNQPLWHLGLGLPLLLDLLPSQGPLGGLRTALFFSSSPWVLAVSVDAPLVAPAVLAALSARAQASRRPAVVCHSSRGMEVFPGLFHTRLGPRLETYLKEERRLRPFVAGCRPEVISPEETLRLDPAGLSFLNCNTPEELAKAAELLGGQRMAASGKTP